MNTHQTVAASAWDRAGAQLQPRQPRRRARDVSPDPTRRSLGDGGAQQAGRPDLRSTTTFLLTHWARDRDGDRLPLEMAVHTR